MPQQVQRLRPLKTGPRGASSSVQYLLEQELQHSGIDRPHPHPVEQVMPEQFRQIRLDGAPLLAPQVEQDLQRLPIRSPLGVPASDVVEIALRSTSPPAPR